MQDVIAAQLGSNTPVNMAGPAYVFVVGHVLSGVGKGTIASSVGLTLRAHRFRVTAVKIDPYLNEDSGTISPYEHGECYVLSDGMEVDLDAGNYERFIEDLVLSKDHSITAGQIYAEVHRRERKGEYLGKTVQVIPQLTDEIRARIERAARIPVIGDNGELGPPDVVIVELGGTVGDIESLPFLHVLSHFEAKTRAPVCFVSVGLIVKNNNELKTKPLQSSVQELNRYGIRPDVLCLRCDVPSDEFPLELKEKISDNCNVPLDSIVVSGKVPTIYHVPELLWNQQMTETICRKLRLLWRGTLRPNWGGYRDILTYFEECSSYPEIRVAIVAKYTGAPDTYLSLTRALEHAAFTLRLRLKYEFVDAEHLECALPEQLHERFDRILVPGGFGDRGIEGKMEAIRQARNHHIPYLGICLGMQLLIIDHCRTVLGLVGANSTEFDPSTLYPVVVHLSSYGEELVEQLGGTMKLGNQQARLRCPSAVFDAYHKCPGYDITTANDIITERYRHRYEVGKCFTTLEDKKLLVSGVSADQYAIPVLVENHDPEEWWAVGCQFHPEFVSRNNHPHPLFWAFLKGGKHLEKKK